jgi:hypothetical protein
MNLQLKNIKVNLTFSEETIMFQADIFANNKKVGYASNDGRGGCTFYNAYPNEREALKQAEAYAQTLPSTFFEFNGEKHEIKSSLEHWIDDQISEYVNAKERAKFEKKVQKMCDTKIVWGIPNSGSVRTIGFNGLKINLQSWYGTTHGRMSIEKLVAKVKGELKAGEVIFNKNIPI